MFKFELRKIFSQKQISLFLLCLIILYGFLFANTLSTYSKYQPPVEDVNRLFQDYYDDPIKVEGYFKEREALKEEYYEITHKMTPTEVQAYGPLVLPNRYTLSDQFTDDFLYGLLNQQIKAVHEHPTRLQSVIYNAKQNMLEYDNSSISQNTYVYRYQQNIVDVYELVLAKAPEIGFEYVRGWDLLFSAKTMDLFIVISVIIFSTVIFSQERNEGFYTIMKATPRGRGSSVVAKLYCAAFLCILTIAVYMGITILMIAAKVGFSSSMNYIQSITLYQYAPLALRMIEYLGIVFIFKLLSTFLLSAVVLLISTASPSVALTYISSIAFYAFGYLVSPLPSDSFIYQMSLVNILGSDTLFTKARFVNVLGFPLPHIVVICVIYCLLILLLCISLYHIFISSIVNIKRRKKRAPFPSSLCRKHLSFKHHRFRLHSLFYHETYKTIFTSRMAILGVILIVIQAILANNYYAPYSTQTEQYYQEYLMKVHGPVTATSRDYIEHEGYRISQGLSNAEQAHERYQSGEIDEDTYNAIMNEYFYALHHEVAYKKIYSQLEYADYVAEAKGIAIHIINPRAWTQFFDNTLLFPLLIWCITVAAGIIPFEYQSGTGRSGFAPILRSTKQGRHETFRAKLLTTCLLSIIGFFIHSTINYIFFSLKHGIVDMDAPLLSLQMFSSINQELTIGQYLPIFYTVCMFCYMAVSVVVYCISEFTHHLLLTLCFTTVGLFLPTVMIMCGITNAKYLDTFSYLKCSPVYTLSAEKSLWEKDWAQMNLLIFAVIVTCIIVLVAAWIKSQNNSAASNVQLKRKRMIS